MIIVTGGAGFIGANFVLQQIKEKKEPLINFDLLTYAGNLESLKEIEKDPNYTFTQGDIRDQERFYQLLKKYRPRAVVHFAAESHVDRSISSPDPFIETNIIGTYRLLEASLSYFKELNQSEQKAFRFLHVSTDEVYGSLGFEDAPFTETTPYAPNSPYSASKASSDHLARAYFETYGLPVLISHCTNNYGPYQFPEKLIPLVIFNALQGKKLPIYGDGLNERNWIHVHDHCRALALMIEKGNSGEVYNVGSERSISNKDVVEQICLILDELKPESLYTPHASLIEHVEDRLGHDRRYDVSSNKAEKELNWTANISFKEGLKQTVEWYLENQKWVEHIATGEYQKWVKQQYEAV